MKYKIKVTVSLDGTSRFYPMYKEHWYSGWKNVRIGPPLCYSTKEEAEKAIEDDIKWERRHTTDHSYDIEYKEKEND